MNKKVISILGSVVAVGLLTTACSDITTVELEWKILKKVKQVQNFIKLVKQ